MRLCGCEVFVQEMGSGDRACLLLHGWGCSHETMTDAALTLAPYMRVVSLDFPGHGRSGKPPEPWGVPEYMEMTAQLIREKGLAPCDIVAHSFGGRVAILLAATYPELVSQLVLTGAAGIRKPQMQRTSRKQTLYQRLRGAAEWVDRTHLFGNLPEKGREMLVQRFGSADYKALSPEMRKTFNKVIALDLSDKLSQVKAPSLLYWGEEDTETPLWMGQKMEKEMPSAALITEKGCGHFAFMERSAVFCAILRSFLAQNRQI